MSDLRIKATILGRDKNQSHPISTERTQCKQETPNNYSMEITRAHRVPFRSTKTTCLWLSCLESLPGHFSLVQIFQWHHHNLAWQNNSVVCFRLVSWIFQIPWFCLGIWPVLSLVMYSKDCHVSTSVSRTSTAKAQVPHVPKEDGLGAKSK